MIKCIRNIGYGNLTLDKQYKVSSWSDSKFYFYDDNGSMSLSGYPKSLFEYDKDVYGER